MLVVFQNLRWNSNKTSLDIVLKLIIDTDFCSSVIFCQPFCDKLFQNNHMSFSAEYLLKLWETSKFRFGIIFVRLYIHSCLMFQRKRKLRTIELWNSGFTLGDYASLCSILSRVEDLIYWNWLKDRLYLVNTLATSNS